MSERTVPKEFNDANIAAARRFKAERDALRRALAAFVAAYELQDATNFTDQMRDAYATASVLVGGPQ